MPQLIAISVPRKTQDRVPGDALSNGASMTSRLLKSACSFAVTRPAGQFAFDISHSCRFSELAVTETQDASRVVDTCHPPPALP